MQTSVMLSEESMSSCYKAGSCKNTLKYY